MPLPIEKEYYTYADYCTWDDSERWELIEGVPHAMSPAPSRVHQEISGNLHNQLYNFLKGKPCKVYHAPFDVRLNASKTDDTVVQPDLLVVCDQSKLDGAGCKGAPDMIIEILSPSTSRHDRIIKFQLYQKAEVQEYWTVDPDTKSLQTYVLDNGRYYATTYTEADIAPIQVLEGCNIDLSEIFAE